MSISKQNLSVVIVAFKSSHVIYDCIQSIPNEIKIIIVENSNDKSFKESIEKKYNNVKCILSSSNLGMGPGNNLGLKYVKTDYAIILNPDVILQKNTIQEIIDESHNIDSFAILAPLSIDKKYLDVISDRNPKKNGFYTPNFKIKIVTEEYSRNLKPDYYLVLPWHFKKEILLREKKIRSKGVKFIFPLPNLRIE